MTLSLRDTHGVIWRQEGRSFEQETRNFIRIAIHLRMEISLPFLLLVCFRTHFERDGLPEEGGRSWKLLWRTGTELVREDWSWDERVGF